MKPPSRAMVGRLTLESVVIIASILAAFALDTWWEGRSERREEQQALDALHTEFTAAREKIEIYESYQVRILHSVASVSDSLNNALERGDRSIVLPDTALAWAYIPPTTSLSLGTLDGLVSSGRLGIVEDRRLRAALAAWGAELDELSEEEFTSRELAYGAMDETLRERTSTYGLWSTAERMFENELSPAEMAATRPVPVDTEVLGVFHLRENILEHGVDEFEPLLAAVDSILVMIERSRR